MNKIIGIYKITSPTNCIYIGQSINILSRFNDYYKLDCKYQIRLYRSFIKYGVKNHKFEIIEECEREKLNEREIYWINFYDCFDTPHGLNLINRGASIQRSKETRDKISKAFKGIPSNRKNYKHSEEIRKKISDGQKKSEKFKTIMASKEYREKLRNARLGIKLSKETKEKLRQINLGKKYSEERKLKMSNRIITDEQRNNLSISVKKSWDRIKQEKLTMIF